MIDQMTKEAVYRGYTLAELTQAFDLVCDPNDWRAPINHTLVKSQATPANLAVITAAVIFFTATAPTFTPLDYGMVKVTAVGYRSGLAGP